MGPAIMTLFAIHRSQTMTNLPTNRPSDQPTKQPTNSPPPTPWGVLKTEAPLSTS